MVWVLPGWLASRWLLPRSTPLERVASALLLGPCLTVPLAYLPAYVGRATIGPFWILAWATVISGAGWALARWRPRKHPAAAPAPPGEASGQGWLVVGGMVLVAVALTAITRHKGIVATNFFAPCPHKAALFLLEDGTGGGLSVYGHQWQQWVTHLVQHPTEPGFGLRDVLVYHRVGTTAVFSHLLAFHGGAAPIVATLYYHLLVGLGAALLISRRIASPWLVLLVAGIFELGVHNTTAYMVNENVLQLGLCIGALHLLLRDTDSGSALAAGGVFALAAGVRPESMLAIPALMLLRFPAGAARRSNLLALTAGLLLFYLPWAWTNIEVFGTPIANPALMNAQTPVEIFGLSFTFHPLIYPFADAAYRAEWAAFPMMFQLPLEHLHYFGAAFWLIVAAGAMEVPRRWLLAFAIWAAPITLMLLFTVWFDHAKLSYILLGFAPVPLLAGYGLAGLPAMSRPRRIILAAGAIVLLVQIPWLLRSASFPEDTRKQYGDVEVPRYGDVASERELLTRPAPWPTIIDMDAQPIGELLDVLTHAAPPQRSVGPTTHEPVVFWRLIDRVTLSATLRLTDHPQQHPAVVDAMADMRLLDRFTTVVLKLEGVGEEATVDVDWTEDRLELTVTPTAGEAVRYLWLGFREHSAIPFPPISVRSLERVIPLRYHWVQRGPAKPHLHLATNAEWRFRIDGGDFRLRPGSGPPQRCTTIRVGREQVHMGPGAILRAAGGAGATGAVLMRTTAEWPPSSPAPCPDWPELLSERRGLGSAP